MTKSTVSIVPVCPWHLKDECTKLYGLHYIKIIAYWSLVESQKCLLCSETPRGRTGALESQSQICLQYFVIIISVMAFTTKRSDVDHLPS